MNIHYVALVGRFEVWGYSPGMEFVPLVVVQFLSFVAAALFSQFESHVHTALLSVWL